MAYLLYFSDSRAWVGDCAQDATHSMSVPDPEDHRWIIGRPTVLDTRVLTLSPFYPSGRLGCCVEYKESKPFTLYPNHPSFGGCVAWMHLETLRTDALPINQTN